MFKKLGCELKKSKMSKNLFFRFSGYWLLVTGYCKHFLWIVMLASGMILPNVGAEAAEEGLYNSRGKRDPFVPLVTTATRVSSGLVSVENIEELNVEGVVYDPAGSIVVINGTVLKEGEELGVVKVLKIKPDGALFSVNGVETFKPLYEDTKKR